MPTSLCFCDQCYALNTIGGAFNSALKSNTTLKVCDCYINKAYDQCVLSLSGPRCLIDRVGVWVTDIIYKMLHLKCDFVMHDFTNTSQIVNEGFNNTCGPV